MKWIFEVVNSSELCIKANKLLLLQALWHQVREMHPFFRGQRLCHEGQEQDFSLGVLSLRGL